MNANSQIEQKMVYSFNYVNLTLPNNENIYICEKLGFLNYDNANKPKFYELDIATILDKTTQAKEGWFAECDFNGFKIQLPYIVLCELHYQVAKVFFQKNNTFFKKRDTECEEGQNNWAKEKVLTDVELATLFEKLEKGEITLQEKDNEFARITDNGKKLFPKFNGIAEDDKIDYTGDMDLSTITDKYIKNFFIDFKIFISSLTKQTDDWFLKEDYTQPQIDKFKEWVSANFK